MARLHENQERDPAGEHPTCNRTRRAVVHGRGRDFGINAMFSSALEVGRPGRSCLEQPFFIVRRTPTRASLDQTQRYIESPNCSAGFSASFQSFFWGVKSCGPIIARAHPSSNGAASPGHAKGPLLKSAPRTPCDKSGASSLGANGRHTPRPQTCSSGRKATWSHIKV